MHYSSDLERSFDRLAIAAMLLTIILGGVFSRDEKFASLMALIGACLGAFFCGTKAVFALRQSKSRGRDAEASRVLGLVLLLAAVVMTALVGVTLASRSSPSKAGDTEALDRAAEQLGLFTAGTTPER